MSSNKNIYSFVSEDICLHFWSQIAGFIGIVGYLRLSDEKINAGREGWLVIDWASARKSIRTAGF